MEREVFIYSFGGGKCMECGEEYDTLYVLAGDYSKALYDYSLGRGFCMECLIDELDDNYHIMERF